jgi:hypothetical protein
MLFAFPFQRHPLQDLHTSVRAFIRLLHRGDLDPDNFQLDECCTGELLARAQAGEQLMQKLETFYKAWFQLGEPERREVRRAFILTNRIERQVNGMAPRIPLEDLPEEIKAPARDLFVHLYEKSLTKTRSMAHWEQFYEQLPLKVCPFCGVEMLHHPALLKQDYDHVLCKSRYPFAAVNLLNLVPCGRDCNQIFKHDKDMIWNDVLGERRRAFFPFRAHDQTIRVNLDGSKLPETDDAPGDWQIAFEPDTEEIHTWVNVFELRDRYRLEVFPDYYDRWRQDFLDWVSPQSAPNGGWNSASIKDRVAAYSQTLEDERFKDQRFLKLALFRFVIAEDDDSLFAALAAQLNAQPGNN